jgi:chlorobactene glucosyltransferase
MADIEGMGRRLPLVIGFNAFLTGATLVSEQLVQEPPALPEEEKKAGRVLVIIPARNEARNIRRAVDTMLMAAGRYGEAEVLVVDDGSTDTTPEILTELQATHIYGTRLHVLRLDEALPEGWMGKPRACWAGAQSEYAEGAEWLLFVDADTQGSPRLLGRLVAGAEETGADLYSIFAHQELISVAERLIMPHLFYALAVGFPWRAVNDPNSAVAIANGQCILVRRASYEAVGGHATVRDAIAEDQALAEQLKRAGYRLFVADGRDGMRVRMYTSLPELWEGWTKNAYLGLGDRAWLLLVAIFFGLAAGVLPFIALPRALRARRRGEALAWTVTLFALLRNRTRAMRELDVPRPYALTVPVGAILCSGIAFSAWFKVVSGQGVTWKGRRYGERKVRQRHASES